MNIELNKNFPLEHSADNAWELLSNIEAVALCMPGAEITEVVDQNNFKGKVKLKLGPVKMSFDGDINVQSIDPAGKRIQLMAKGQDNKGTSTASMELTANVEVGDASASSLIGDAKVVVDGKLAGFGARMMSQVSDQILEQFADNFRDKLNESASSVAVAESPVNEQASMDGATGASAENNEADANAGHSTSTVHSSESGKPGNEINGFKFAWSVLVGMVSGLFKRKS